MYAFRYVLLASLLMATATDAYAAEFGKELVNQKEAEAQGLKRVNLEELKKLIPGILKVKDFKGKKRILTFNPDGSVDRKDQTGKWNFDEGKNAYCVLFQERMRSEKKCFAVFRAKDGSNFFDFDVENGFFAHQWHPVE
jgi:hypothetical protein